jgi:hypothetical protein
VPTASGFATCSYELKHATLARSSFLTFGIDPSGTDPSAVATSLRSHFFAASSLGSVLDSEVALIATHVSLGTDGGEDITGIDPNPGNCTRSGSSPTPNVAVLVHKRTARGGRRGRGRLYLPWACVPSDLSENGTILGTRVTTLQTAVTAWLTACSGGAGPVVILHRDSLPGTEHPTPPGPPNVVTSMTVDPLVATQRRRLGR